MSAPSDERLRGHGGSGRRINGQNGTCRMRRLAVASISTTSHVGFSGVSIQTRSVLPGRSALAKAFGVVGIEQCQRNAALAFKVLQPIPRTVIHGIEGGHMATLGNWFPKALQSPACRKETASIPAPFPGWQWFPPPAKALGRHCADSFPSAAAHNFRRAHRSSPDGCGGTTAPVVGSVACRAWAAMVSGRRLRLDMLAAIDVQFGTRDVRRGFGAEEIDGLGHFFRLAQAAQRNLRDDLFSARRQNRGFNFARRN